MNHTQTARLSTEGYDHRSKMAREFKQVNTLRDSELLSKLAEGHSIVSLAKLLGVCRVRLTSRVRKTYMRLGAMNAAQAVAIAMRRGIIS